MPKSRRDFLNTNLRIVCGAILLCIAGASLGCGGAISGSRNNSVDPLHLGVTPGPLGSIMPQTIQVRLGSEPSQRVVSLLFTINSLQATNSGGQNLELLNGPIKVEFTHTAIVSEPVFVRQIYQDTYSTLTIPEMSGQVVFYDASGQLVTQALSVPLQSFSHPFVLGPDPLVLSLDLDILQSFPITDPGTVTVMNPLILTTDDRVPDPVPNQSETGAVIFLTGTVTNVDPTTKTISIQPSAGDPMDIAYDVTGGTQFVNCDPSILGQGLIAIEGATQLEGIVKASRVEMISNFKNNETDELYGLLGGYAPDHFNYNLIAEGGVGSHVDSALIGKNITVDWLAAGYSINTTHLGLDLVTNEDLVFDETRAFPGQFVEVQAGTLLVPDPDSANAGFIQTHMIKLQEQTLSGQVSSYVYDPRTQSGTFNLIVAEDSSIKRLNAGLISIIVRQIPQTYLRNSPTFANGDSVKVRGLLFADSQYSNVNYQPPSSAVAFIMVADRISR